ncbi:MAG: YadA-like family protein, partial [Alphaproteobacteria bacterium]|nr:YadA-like family protein [Alphaproteobacteria bacterium]
NRINTEAAERRAEDASLSNRINTEAAERQAEDAALSNRIDTEAAERRAEDTALSNRINTEAAERRAEDTALSNRINTEAAERRAEDASLSNRINTEAAERRAEDAALSRRIAETGAAVEQEAATRAAADTALDVRVTALEEESGGQSEAIRELQRDVKVQEVDGGLIRTQGNFVDGLAHTVGENVMILDDAMGSVDADGHYTKASKDADGKIVTTMADNIEKLDEHLHNASEALGGSFDESTDKWSANLEVATGKDAVKYGNITVEKVTDALNQIITNVGTKDDLGEEFNGIKTSNSLNKNIAALNDTIGNLKNMNDSTNITNGNPGSPGYKVPKNVVDVLNNIDATLGTVHGLSDKLRKAGKYNGNLGNETVESHLAAIDTSIGNRANMNNTSFDSYASLSGKDIASAVSSVASNVGTAADLGKAMNGVSAKNTVNSNIASLNMAIGNISDLKKTVYASEATNVTDAICALDSNMYKLDYQVNDLGVKYQRLRRELRIGMSSLAAMSAMAPNARAAGNTQLTIGTGAYADHTAVAVGAFHWITNNLMVNAGVAWGDTDDAIYRMGLSYSF